MAGDADSGYQPLSDVHSTGGMTLRDYFAAKAMASVIGTSAAPCLTGVDGLERHIAQVAYGIADAMLAARTSP
jgi:hypothetical protein